MLTRSISEPFGEVALTRRQSQDVMAEPQMELFIVRAHSCNIDMFENVRADIRRLTEQEPTLSLKLGVVFFNLGLHAVFLYRLSRWLYLHHLGPLAVVVTYLNSVFTGAQISRGAAIGKGLVMYHPQGTVVGPTVIGEHCTLMQSNVIGQLQGGGDRPIIGDHFYAGAGAKMLGKIQIGNHVRVGSNSVVTKSLPDGVTAVGIPAKIIYRRELSGEGGQDAASCC